MKEQTRKEMQQKLADYRQPAPNISWAELEKALAANKKEAVVPMWGKWLSAAAAVLVVAGLGWQLLKTDNHTKDGQETASNILEQPEVTPSPKVNQEGENLIATGSESDAVMPIRTQKNLIVRKESRHAAKAEESFEDTSSDETAKSSKESEKPALQNHQEEKGQKPADKDNQPPVHQKEIHTSEPYHGSPSSAPSNLLAYNSENRLTAKAYLSNSLAGSNSVSSMTPVMHSAEPYGLYSDATTLNYAKALFEQQPTVKEHAEHHQPIRLGLSIRYQLDSRWSVEAGVAYTSLTSDITRTASGNTYKMEQKLSYVGIPVNANYLLWSDRHFDVYASAGGAVEKMVKGKRYNEDHVNTENVSIRPLQFSLNCAAGAEFKLDRMFSIYAEPGLTYHIDNHSKIPTYYQNKPLGFNLNLGLRFNLNKK